MLGQAEIHQQIQRQQLHYVGHTYNPDKKKKDWRIVISKAQKHGLQWLQKKKKNSIPLLSNTMVTDHPW